MGICTEVRRGVKSFMTLSSSPGTDQAADLHSVCVCVLESLWHVSDLFSSSYSGEGRGTAKASSHIHKASPGASDATRVVAEPSLR